MRNTRLLTIRNLGVQKTCHNVAYPSDAHGQRMPPIKRQTNGRGPTSCGSTPVCGIVRTLELSLGRSRFVNGSCTQQGAFCVHARTILLIDLGSPGKHEDEEDQNKGVDPVDKDKESNLDDNVDPRSPLLDSMLSYRRPASEKRTLQPPQPLPQTQKQGTTCHEPTEDDWKNL